MIPTSLLKLSSENTSRAVKMFLGVQKFMGDTSEATPPAARFELAQKLLHQVGNKASRIFPRTQQTRAKTDLQSGGLSAVQDS